MPMFDPRIDQAGAQSLADLMGGGSAAQYLGGQQAMIEQMNEVNKNLSLADLDKVGLANDHSRAMNPMLQQVQRGLVREADSKTPEYFQGIRQGELGDARTRIAQAKLKEGTLDTDISAGNSKNQTQMIQDTGKQMLDMLGYVGTLPGGPTEQRRALQQLIASHGLDKNPATHPIWNQLLASPDFMKQGESLATRMMNLNPEHLSKMTVGKQNNDSEERVAKGNNAATLGAASMRSKDYDKEMEIQKLKQKLESRVMELTQKEAVGVATPQEKQERKMLVEYALTLRSMGAPKMDVGLPQTNPVANAMGGMGFNASPPPPNAPISDIVKYYSQQGKK